MYLNLHNGIANIHEFNSFINMHLYLWSNLPQIEKFCDELWSKVPYSYDMK